ncbi:MAG: hypothetical protein PVI86_12305, partial [Phycisphaerae bacterium]
MPESYKVKDHTKLGEIAELPYTLQLMMGVDAVRASIGWLAKIPKTDSACDRADLAIAMITAMGWCGEAFRLLGKGRKKGHISGEMLEGNAALIALWNDLFTEQRPPLIRKFHRVRDKYFGHWDVEVARDFIGLQARGEQLGPLIESDDKSGFLRTRYRWAQAAVSHDLVDDPSDLDAMRELVKDIARTLGTTGNLLSQIVAALLKKSRLDFEP